MFVLDIECEIYKFTGSFSGGMLFVPLFQGIGKTLYGRLPKEIDGLGRRHLLFDNNEVKYLGTYKVDNILLVQLRHVIDRITLADKSKLVLLYYVERHDG